MYALKRIGRAYTHSDRAYINAHFGTLRAYAWTLELREELEICTATGAQSGSSIDEQNWACMHEHSSQADLSDHGRSIVLAHMRSFLSVDTRSVLMNTALHSYTPTAKYIEIYQFIDKNVKNLVRIKWQVQNNKH